MFPKSVLVGICSALAGSAALAQDEQDQTPVTRAEFTQLQQLVQANAVAVEDLTAGMRQLADQVAKNNADISDLKTQLARLQQDAEVLADVQQNHETQLGQIASRGQDGSYHWRFDAKNTSARDELRRGIQSTVPEQGTLIVENLMGRDQYLVVNGQQHLVVADATLRLPVPVGTVATRLPGQDTVTWTVGFPNFEQSIQIQPTAPVRWVSRRPLSPVEPIYIEPMTWYDSFVIP